jgi:alpha-L-fucosidase
MRTTRFSFHRTLMAALFLIGASAWAQAQTYLPTWESIDSRPVPQWFADAKFGIFIHWGIYSVPAWAPAKANVSIYDKYAEWYWHRIGTPPDNNKELNKVRQIFTEHHHRFWGANFKYQDFAPMFRAEYFQPEEWAELFRQAGAKYVVLTSKHHEGFALWPSPLSWNWNSVDIGPHRDLCGELSKAVRDKGLRMGFYYSLYEWFNPLYRANVNKYVDDYMIPQMKDLVTRYHPDILWTDGEWEHPAETWKSAEFLAWLYNESPVKDRVVVNDRWGKETRGKHGGFFSTEYDDMLKSGKMKIGEVPRPWEECRGIGSSFGYNRAEMLDDYQTSEQLIHLLINKVAAGGNLLLNIGPTADGRIPVIMQQRLMDIGAWLKVNGEAIYETQAWQGRKTPHGKNNQYYTAKGKDLYVIVTQWPNDTIEIEGIKKPSSVSMPGWNGRINVRFAGNKLTIQPPAVSPGNLPCQYAWVFKLSDAL